MRTIFAFCLFACSPAVAFHIASRRDVLKATAVGVVGLAPLAPMPAHAKGKRQLELAASEAEEKVSAQLACISACLYSFIFGHG